MVEEPRIINLTPHPINICLPSGGSVTIPPSGAVARVAQHREPAGELPYQGARIPLVRSSYGEVQGLPQEPEPGTYYVVSILVAQALAGNPAWSGHILVPDTGPGSVVRDENGRIICVRQLILY